MNLLTKVTELNRVGKTVAARLRHLGVETVKDLLFYFPFRYEDYSHIVPIKDLQEWTPTFAEASTDAKALADRSAGKHVTIKGKIELIASKRSPRKRKIITEAVVADATGQIRIIWFGQPFIAKILRAGDEVYFSGKVSTDMLGPQMVSPAYERVKKTETTHTARIVPLYPLTEGITQKQLRFLMSQVIPLAKNIREWLPDDIRDRVDVMPLPEALRAIHFPESPDELKYAERRLKFGELFILQLRAEMIRQSLKRYSAPSVEFKEKEIKDFVAALPWQLTKDQKVAAWEILQDIQKKEPMNRLLEGDVGSGKTVVAAIAMYSAVLNGYQAVMMAPTEILAQQHFESLVALLKDRAVTIGLVTRTMKKIDGDKAINSNKENVSQSIATYRNLSPRIVSGEINIIIGTHALLTEDVQFQGLGLVIIDEQHRFGVEQRKILREKSGDPQTVPHFLSMTATPIPRSFALTLYGDLDLSIIKEMPPGRKPIKTRLVEPHNREKAYQFIREQVKRSRQVFVVCPLIEEGTRNKEQGTNKLQITNYKLPITSDKKSVLAEYAKLSQKIFPDLKVAYLHGKMKAKEKEKTMADFKSGKIDILVSTSVVEVGVDIPNASVMMIESAERFGLAQLHQFRGRVGRSEHQSYCFVFTESDSESVHERLQFFEKNNDGFALAEYDLERRGPGDVYGTAQSGMMQLRFATLKDADVIKLARDAARGIDFEKYPVLKEKVKEWERGVHLE